MKTSRRVLACSLLWCWAPVRAASPPAETLTVPAEARVTVTAANASEVEAALDGGLLQPLRAPLALSAGGHWLAARGRDPLGYAGPLFWVRLAATAPRATAEDLSDGARRYPVDVRVARLPDGTVTAVSWAAEVPPPGTPWTLRERDEVLIRAEGGQARAVIDGVVLGPAKAVTVQPLSAGRHALRVEADGTAMEWPLDVAAGGR